MELVERDVGLGRVGRTKTSNGRKGDRQTQMPQQYKFPLQLSYNAAGAEPSPAPVAFGHLNPRYQHSRLGPARRGLHPLRHLTSTPNCCTHLLLARPSSRWPG